MLSGKKETKLLQQKKYIALVDIAYFEFVSDVWLYIW